MEQVNLIRVLLAKGGTGEGSRPHVGHDPEIGNLKIGFYMGKVNLIPLFSCTVVGRDPSSGHQPMWVMTHQ